MSLCVCVCSNCDDEPKVQTYCPNCRLPPERCTWLVSVCVSVFVCVCVCVCVQGTAVLQRYMGRSGGDTNGLQLWPRGLWELWLEQRGRGEKRRMRERQKRFNGGRGADNFASWGERKTRREHSIKEEASGVTRSGAKGAEAGGWRQRYVLATGSSEREARTTEGSFPTSWSKPHQPHPLSILTKALMFKKINHAYKLINKLTFLVENRPAGQDGGVTRIKTHCWR